MTIFRKFTLVLTIVLGASSAQAYIYESTFLSLGKDYLSLVGRVPTDKVKRLFFREDEKCKKRYSQIWSDGVIDMRIVIGYFDWTTGTQVYYNGQNFGLSPSIDLGAYSALREIITSPCPGRAEFCGFSQTSPYRFTKMVSSQGRRFQARVEIVFASVSEYLSANTGRYSVEQQKRSQDAEASFHSALRNADAVFYFGHSRDGGGPDFSPPVFRRGTNKINYGGYYQVQKPGEKKMLAALASSGQRASILGLMSCDSRDHFLSKLKKVAPGMGLISSKDVLKVDGVYTALIGAADAILRGQCQKGFLDSIHRTDFNKRYIAMDRMFE